MENPNHVSDLFDHDENFKSIMKRMLVASIEESFDAIMITEAGSGYPIVYVNPAFCALSGYTPEEVLGNSPGILQGPETDGEVLERLAEDLNEGRLFHGRAINYKKDGTTFMMEWKIVPIAGPTGVTSHFMAIQRDVTADEG
ncbi:MAG: PAS domain S-box protein [Desulfobacterales bacterium]|nr:PAS domain S-box protein [Desulfobacterales bacterium]